MKEGDQNRENGKKGEVEWDTFDLFVLGPRFEAGDIPHEEYWERYVVCLLEL